MQFLRLIIGGAVLLGITYFIVSIYSRSVRREKLEKRWDEEPVEGTTREAYVEAGLAEYEQSLRKKLILLIFVIPPIVVGVIMYVIN